MPEKIKLILIEDSDDDDDVCDVACINGDPYLTEFGRNGERLFGIKRVVVRKWVDSRLKL